MEVNRDLVRGSTSLLILSLLNQEGDLYGYRITKLIKEKTENILDFKEGTLYPALYKLEENKWIKSKISEVNGRKRKYYRITDQGIKHLEILQREWVNFNKLVNGVIGYA